MVVAHSECGQVRETVNGNGVLRRGEPGRGSVAGEFALGNIVRRLGTNKEAVTTDDGVRGEGRALIGPAHGLRQERITRQGEVATRVR